MPYNLFGLCSVGALLFITTFIATFITTSMYNPFATAILAYIEAIGYNRKNLERELQNESRQPNRQQSKAKRREEEL